MQLRSGRYDGHFATSYNVAVVFAHLLIYPPRVSGPEFLILRRTAAASYAPSGVEVCISISNPDAPDLVLSPDFRDVLRLRFDDVDQRDVGSGYFVDFNEAHARDILAFVDRWQTVDRIVVHCLAGLSRSPAVAIGLCEVFGWPLGSLETDYALTNKWIRAELVRVGHQVAEERRHLVATARPKRSKKKAPA